MNFTKDPDAVLDYGFDWSDWLQESETIQTSSWTVPTGITKDSDSSTATATKIWLSGGTAGRKYMVTNKIVTDGGRTDERSHIFTITNR